MPNRPRRIPQTGTRNLLIALNRHGRMMRSAICRLGLEPDLWRDRRSKSIAGELGVPTRQLRYALDALRSADEDADQEQRRAERLGISILTRVDEAYPKALFDHPLPPPVLYCRGTLPDGPAVGMVGSRKCDGYGREVAEYLASALARSGVTVVSGFAIGIDQAAHRAAVRGPGKTVAVLGCGIDVDYPRNSRSLAGQIADSGCLLSEFPLGREPRNWHFPIRNRVIAALSGAIVVVQAKPKSGSLITAHAALELGRDVFAVPGRIFDELSMGTNDLLADGAIPVTCVEDVLEPLGLAINPRPVRSTGSQGQDTGAETAADMETEPLPLPKGMGGDIVARLPSGGDGRTAEDLAAELDTSVDQILGSLLELELSGWIRRLPGPLYCR